MSIIKMALIEITNPHHIREEDGDDACSLEQWAGVDVGDEFHAEIHDDGSAWSQIGKSGDFGFGEVKPSDWFQVLPGHYSEVDEDYNEENEDES